MKIDWQQILNRLHTYPQNAHRIRPPCSVQRLETVESQLGKLPDVLVDMLNAMNGARLFINGMQLVSLFGVSEIPPLPPLEWAAEWYIDKFTPAWRSSSARPKDWAVGMTNYGGLIVLDCDGTTREWDFSQRMWTPGVWTFDAWIEELLRRGDAYMKE